MQLQEYSAWEALADEPDRCNQNGITEASEVAWPLQVADNSFDTGIFTVVCSKRAL